MQLDRIIAEVVSKRVRALRKDVGLTQQKLAARAGLLRPHIVRLERGVHAPDVETLRRIARGLGIDLRSLLLGIDWGRIDAAARRATRQLLDSTRRSA